MAHLARLKAVLRAAENRLSPLTCQIVTPYPHWISGSGDGMEWCETCGEKEAARLKAKAGRGAADIMLDGGYEHCAGADTCVHCDGCGLLLDYTLSPSGVERELEHFTDHMPAQMKPDDAVHIARLLDGANWHPDPEVIAACAKLGIRAARLARAEVST